MSKMILISSDPKVIESAAQWADKNQCEFEHSKDDNEDFSADNVVPIQKDIFLPAGQRHSSLYLKSLGEVQTEAIRQALSAAKGNISKASKILNIGRATIYRKIKQYNIDILDSREDEGSSSSAA